MANRAKLRILILGGTGGTGRALIGQALGRGHEVTVLARRPETLRPLAHPRLHVIAGDAICGDASEAFAGQDAVLSAIGTRERLRDVRLYSATMRATLATMEECGVRRLVFVSAAGAGDARNPSVPWLFRTIVIPLLAGREYDDMARAEAIAEASAAQWTAVRPLWLRGGDARGVYRLAEAPFTPRRWGVSRADLAAVMLDLAETGAHARARVWVAY